MLRAVRANNAFDETLLNPACDRSSVNVEESRNFSGSEKRFHEYTHNRIRWSGLSSGKTLPMLHWLRLVLSPKLVAHTGPGMQSLFELWDQQEAELL